MTFLQRVQSLAHLGLGVSTEYGAHRAEGSLDVFALRAKRPDLAAFLELGVETEKGLDADAERWLAEGWPCTYHFLDVNLDEPEDQDEAWLAQVKAVVARARPAWLCGDAGVWHLGARERGQMLLLPPIFCDDAVQAMAEGIVELRTRVGLEVLPENPPGVAFVGELHLLEFFARLCEAADTGMLLDLAHLVMYQRLTGHALTDGLDTFPMERVVEVHVAGTRVQTTDGFTWIDDDHGPEVLDDTWRLFEIVASRATNLRAAVFECERNPLPAVTSGLSRMKAILRAHGGPRWA